MHNKIDEIKKEKQEENYRKWCNACAECSSKGTRELTLKQMNLFSSGSWFQL